jgi:hypothetical protein
MLINDSLISLERDVFLRVLQYLNPKTLRKYIGISEETFERSNHIHFILYRMKAAETPLFKLLITPKNRFIFKEDICDPDIFEIKLEYYRSKRRCYNMLIWLQHMLIEDVPPDIYFNNCKFTNVDVFEGRENSLFNGDILTIVIDMHPNHNMIYYKVNGVISKHIINNIPPKKYRLMLYGDDITLKVLSIKHLNIPPIRPDEKYIYWAYKRCDCEFKY